MSLLVEKRPVMGGAASRSLKQHRDAAPEKSCAILAKLGVVCALIASIKARTKERPRAGNSDRLGYNVN
jgi:hypothetical protein